MITVIPQIGETVNESLLVNGGKIYLSCFPQVQPVLVDGLNQGSESGGQVFTVNYEEAIVTLDPQYEGQTMPVSYINGQSTTTAANINEIIVAFQDGMAGVRADIATIKEQIAYIMTRLPPV